MRAGLDVEISAFARRPQIGARRRRAPSVADGVLPAAEAFLRLAVIVRRRRNADRLAGFDPGVEQRVGCLRILGAERTVTAAPPIGATLPCLGTPEIGEHVGVRPAPRALLCPAIV